MKCITESRSRQRARCTTRAIGVVVLALTACGGSDGALPTSTVTETPVAATEELAFRPVLWCGAVGDATNRPDIGSGGRDLLGGESEDCVVGPSVGDRSDVAGADVSVLGGQWVVEVKFEDAGIERLDAAFASCEQTDDGCPSGRLAIQLDQRLVSAPLVNVPTSNGVIVISGGFTQNDAIELASGILGIDLDADADADSDDGS